MTTNDTFKTFADLTNKNLDRFANLNEINLRVGEKLVSRQLESMTLFMDHSLRLMTLATEAKGYSDYFKGQVEASRAFGERAMSEGKTGLREATEVRDDYRHWFEKTLNEVASDLRPATA